MITLAERSSIESFINTFHTNAIIAHTNNGSEDVGSLLSSEQSSSPSRIPTFYYVVSSLTLIVGIAPLVSLLSDFYLEWFPIEYFGIFIIVSMCSFSLHITNRVCKKEWEEKMRDEYLRE